MLRVNDKQIAPKRSLQEPKNLKNLSDAFYLMVHFSLLNEIMDSPNNLDTID